MADHPIKKHHHHHHEHLRVRPPAAELRQTKLRRLTQAYLSPMGKKPSIQQKSLLQVDMIYTSLQHSILECQSFTTGLFPRYSKDTKEGYIRDSIYCAIACWATSIAYQRLDDNRGRQSELRQTAVKTMRGILFCWMLQGERLEKFKDNNSPDFALHSKFNYKTGERSAGSHEYGHLQIDIIALYLIILVQMTHGGIQIIYTQAEVSFVQNLVFYIERAYRTPDYGMWERGTRYNDGNRELNASSLGMTKAALEAINGFNLYGSIGTSGSVIFVDIDAHNRNRTTFEVLLPRESNSKNTDASLIPTIGFPCFATHDKPLYDKTVEKCIRRLDGKYGFKRFLRDGFKTDAENPKRRFYTEHETCKFGDIENEWPMFYIYFAINALLAGDNEEADRYLHKVKELMVSDRDGFMLVPECYKVPEGRIGFERQNPGIERRIPVDDPENGHFLLAQSLHIVAMLLKNQLIHTNELDPVFRHVPASQRPLFQHRHSAFQLDRGAGDHEHEYVGSQEGDPVVQVALICESVKLQLMLNTYGIQTQTAKEVEPIQIWPSDRLVSVFECLGKHQGLGLSGRPRRPIGALGTCKIYRIFGDTILCYPLLFEVSDFYVAADPAVLIDDIKKDLNFVAKRWKLAGRPTFCLLLREENVRGEHFDQMLDLLVALKNGYVDGIRVRVGRVQNLISAGCVEHIDFATYVDVDFEVEPFTEVEAAGDYVSLRDINKAVCILERDTGFKYEEAREKTTYDLEQMILECPATALRTQAYCLVALWNRHSPEHKLDAITVRYRLEKVYRQAEVWKNWWIVRFCAAKLKKTIDSLAPCITTISVRGKQVTVGMRGYREVVITKPLNPSEIHDAIFETSPPDNIVAAVLMQELLVACSNLLTTKPKLFDGILTIRLGWLIEAMDLLLKYGRKDRKMSKPGEPVKDKVEQLSPTAVKNLLFDLLSQHNWDQLTPLQVRQLNGAVNRVPVQFHDRMWKIMERSPGGISVSGNTLPQQPTLSDMTQYELNFVLTIESLLSKIKHPEYRQVMIEMLMVLSMVLDRNPELSFVGTVNMDELMQKAFGLFIEDKKLNINKKDMTPFYQLEACGKKGKDATATTYFAKAIVDALLKSDNCTAEMFGTSDACNIS